MSDIGRTRGKKRTNLQEFAAPQHKKLKWVHMFQSVQVDVQTLVRRVYFARAANVRFAGGTVSAVGQKKNCFKRPTVRRRPAAEDVEHVLAKTRSAKGLPLWTLLALCWQHCTLECTGRAQLCVRCAIDWVSHIRVMLHRKSPHRQWGTETVDTICALSGSIF